MRQTSMLFAALAAVLAASAAQATPMLGLVNNGNGSATVQITVDDSGSVATEISAVDGGLLGTGDLTFTGAFIADPGTFDIENPGANPITGTTTFGLYLDALATNEVFASFGSVILSPGTYDFLTVTFEGTGSIDAFGTVAQLGVNHSLFASIDIVPEPASVSLLALACAAPLWRRRRLA